MDSERSKISAIGANVPTYDPLSRRIRWTCCLEPGAPGSWYDMLRRADQLACLHKAGRITFKALVGREDLDKFVYIARSQGFRLEGRIPLHDPLEDMTILYLGMHKSVPDPGGNESLMMRGIMGSPKYPYEQIFSQCHSDDFKTEILSPKMSQQDQRQLLRMHRYSFSAFPYSFAAKLKHMLESPQDYVLVGLRCRLDGKLYGFVNSESHTFHLADGRRLRVSEFDNLMRLPMPAGVRFRGGLSRRLRAPLALASFDKGADVCYTECRAGVRAVNASSHQIGMKYGGTLQQHIYLGGRDHLGPVRELENLNIWYLLRNAHERLVQAG